MRDTVAAVLRNANLPVYDEPDSPEACVARYDKLHAQARCTIDTIGPGIKTLGRMVVRARGEGAGPFKDFIMSPEQIFVPDEFTERLDAPRLKGRCLWSTASLQKSLRQAALVLGLPLANGEVPPKVIRLVDARKKLSKNDPATEDTDETGHSMLDHYRPYWLALSEFCKLAHEHELAFVLAG